ncbi:MAG: hypothetical protein KFKLKKLM_01671 [Flavobacteriales bacterium]|nr:hypothetical protein [Flavobacteriales bacterium]
MYKYLKPVISIDVFLNDCRHYENKGQTYDVSYPEFLKYFDNIKDDLTKHNLIIGINFTYGWMPTILDFCSEDFDKAVEILNRAKDGNPLTVDQLIILKKLFNNSLVGTSKLLHFINPNKFAIWDSRVYRYLTGKEAYNHRIGSCEAYLEFLSFCEYLTQTDEYEVIHNSICQKMGYSITKFRSAEMIMYLNGGKQEKICCDN